VGERGGARRRATPRDDQEDRRDDQEDRPDDQEDGRDAQEDGPDDEEEEGGNEGNEQEHRVEYTYLKFSVKSPELRST